MRKFFIILTLFVVLGSTRVAAQAKVDTYIYAKRDTCDLKLDLYEPTGGQQGNRTTIVYLFGGGFITGSTKDKQNVDFFEAMASRGYRVAAIDYRLGLKGVKKVGIFNSKVVFRAVDLAVEDLVSATKYLIDNGAKLGIDTSRMVLVGSSAGAITVLQTDYEMANRTAVTKPLPVWFRYRGVVSLAGSVFSLEGRPKYATPPAPTLFFHGTADKVVVYNKIKLFKMGMFGTDALVKAFNRGDYPYMAIRYVGARHEVAGFPHTYNQQQICDFIDSAVDKTFINQIDVTVRDRDALENFKLNLTRKELYNGN